MNLFSKFRNFQKGETPPGASPSPAPDQLYDTPPRETYAQQPAGPAPDDVPIPPEEPRAVPETIALNLPHLTLDGLLHKIVEFNASDLHLEVGAPPVYRIRGDVAFCDVPPLRQEDMEGLLYPLISDSQRKAYHDAGNIDFAHEIQGLARFRVNMLKQYHGSGAVFRIIPEKIPTMEQLGLPEVLKRVSMSSKGIVIVTGPTGSGKSTTLAAMINYINHNRKAHIITIEDPIEFSHPSVNCLIDHREVGHHTHSFADALRAALREDPNIILVGEMRDLETIALALTASEMGVLVFGTLHTNSAAKTIDRIIDVFPAMQQEQVKTQLSQSLRAVVAQQLLKTADGKGRCAAIEVLLCNTGLGNLIREGKTNQIGSFMQMGLSEGMQTMDMALISFVKAGKITIDAALSKCQDVNNFKRAGLVR